MNGINPTDTARLRENARCYRNAGVILTTACNLRCPRCFQGDRSQWPDQHAGTTLAQYERILRRLQEQRVHLRNLYLTGGEPTLHPDLSAVVQMTRDWRAAEQIIVVTNGVDRNLEDYGQADIVRISDYGAINRLDAQRLKKQGGRRVVLHRVVHLPWPGPLSTSPAPDVPAECSCVMLEFCGDRVWPCGFAATRNAEGSLSVEENFWYELVNGDPHRQKVCWGCLANRKAQGHKLPPLTLEWGLWESSIGGTLTPRLRCRWLRQLYRAVYYGRGR